LVYQLKIFFYICSTQWATHRTTSDCSTYTFIGLFKAKIGTEGDACVTEDYTMEKISCTDLGLEGKYCDRYEGAGDDVKIAVAAVSALLLFKTILVVMSWQNHHNRILWMLLFVGAVSDGALAMLSFIACGEFNYVMYFGFPDEFPDYQNGYGWKLFLAAGIAATHMSVLALYTMCRGLGENSPPTPGKPADDV
jgi:hypothetical protein